MGVCKRMGVYKNFYVFDLSLLDIDECKMTLKNGRFPCEGGRCENTPGSFKCLCPSGLRTMGESIACEGTRDYNFDLYFYTSEI